MNILYDSNGDGWELGAPYEFSDNGKYWHKGFLGSIDDSKYPYRATEVGWRYIRICKTPVVAGKIHKKPVELIVGEYYKFNNARGWSDLAGRCHKSHTGIVFFESGHSLIQANYCTNIKRMVEAEDD